MKNLFSTIHLLYHTFLPVLLLTAIPITFLNAQEIRATFRFEPDFARIQPALASAPPERDAAARRVATVIELPDPRGVLLPLQVWETSMLAPDFAAQYPDFKTYSLTDPESGIYRGQLFASRFGLQALIFSAEGTFMIHPLDRSNPTVHEAYFEENVQVNCSGYFHSDEFKKSEQQTPEALMAPNGTIIRTYRLAIVTTGEYYQGNGNTVPLANAAVVTDVNNFSAIYKRELAISFTLLTPVHYTNPATDPFVPDESNGIFLTDQAAAVLGANFAQSAYDLGNALHHIPNYGQGWAGWGACNNYALPDPDGAGPVYTTGGHAKGLGWSAGASQSLWFARLIAHEVGHMFGAEHTFNGSGGSCTPPPFGQIATSASYEIGSGTTIMSYIGNCSSDQNIPGSGTADYYFHSKNLEQILSYISSEGTCATTASSGNQPPAVSANPCGGSLTIPKLTPFTLTGSGSDPDGHTVYYNWEQIDEDGANVAPTQGYIGATAGNSSIAPLFRSYPATTSPARTFPALSFILNNANVADFEALPNVARTLNFRLQAHDNQTFGAINNSDVAVTVSGTTGPLTVTVPNGGENWASGNQTITWSVNGTNALSANVRIVMSLDGGQSFPIVLAASTPNDGSQTVSIPALAASATARIKVEGVISNCLSFFDISNANFNFTSSCVALPTAICPTTAQTFPQGDPGLNLSFKVQKPTAVTNKTFTLSSGDPTMNRVRWNTNRTACEAPGGTPPNYQVFKFVVSQSGSYFFYFGAGNYRAVHLFANSFNPNGGCSNFVASTAVGSNEYWDAFPDDPVLFPCTEYYLVVTNQFGGNTTTVTFSGPGTILEVFTPVTNYSYTFAAVNTANNQIAAVSATASFTALGPGNYQIYGLHYKSSGATPPANADPNAFVGQTIAQLLSAGICFNISSTSRPITVTAIPPQLVINEADYHQPVTDDAEFIELKNISASAVNLSGWTLELVDGNTGGATVYQTITLPNVSVPAGGYYVVCGNSAKVPNCNLVVAPSTNLIQNGAPDAIGLRQNGTLRDAVSYEGNAGAPYTESTGVSPGDTGVGVRHSIARFPDGTDTNNNSTNFSSNVCGTPGAANISSTLSIQSVSTAVSCNGGSNGSVALTVSGGIAPYTYLWSNGQTTATATNLVAGTYTVTVTSTYGCAASVTATVTQPAVLSIGKTITNVSCFGGNNGSVALSVTGGTTPYGYLWSNGQTSATATTLVAGTYTATVTDNKGCVATTTSTVTQPAVLSIGKTITNVSCFGGNNGSVALSVTGGTTPYGYLWSNGQTSATATTLVAGTYTATVTDNKGCVATTTSTVTQPAVLSIGKTITNVSCFGGNNGSVALSVTGGTTPYTYLWSNGQTSATATTLVAGTYTATVTDNKGCVATTTSTVTQPAVLSIGKTITNVSCFGGNNGSVALSVSGGTTPYTYLWSNGQTSAIATTLVAGTYTTTVTDNKGCVATTTASVTQPAALSIGKTITNVSCPSGNNGAVALSVTGGTTPYLYLWNNGQTTATATNLIAGIYTATVTDNKGCVATTTASVTQPGVLSISKTITHVSCPGGTNGSVALNVSGGNGPFTYLWNNGQTTATVTNLISGTYTTTITSANGCTATTISTVSQPAVFSISKTITNVSCSGGTNGAVALSVTGATPPYTYLWNNGQTTATASGLAAGNYTATVTDSRGCVGQTTATVTQPAVLFITKTIMNVSCPNGSNGSVALSVTGGTTPYTYLWNNGQATATATILTAGTYTVTVTDNKGCVATTTASVTQPAPFSISRTITNVSCSGGANGAVALSVTGATPPYSYLWSSGQTTATISGLVAGTYTASVTDSRGCVGQTIASVTQPAVLSIAKTITNVSAPGGSDGSVALFVTGGTTPYLYLWSNGQTTATATGLAAGTYTATVTDNKGCTATTSATVTQPTGTPTLLAISANTIRIKYYNAIAPATATAANLPIWGDETGLRTGTYSVSVDTVTFVANTAFRVGELIHITSKSGLQFTGGGATIPFSWVRQSVVTNPSAAVFDTTGTGIILPSAAYSANASYNAAMADVNRDGRQDLVFRYHASYGAATNILVYLRNSDGTFAAPATYTNAESHSGLVGTPDVNNDGFPDIVLFHNFPSAIHVRLNNGSGSFGAAALYSVNNYCNGAKVYDMDNDGDLDIIAFAGIASLSSNTISVLKNNGNGTYAAQISTNTSVFGTSCQPADLDNDGDMDLAYTSSNAFGSSRVFRVYKNDGTGALSLNNSDANNQSKQIMSAFDHNGDGNVDLITLVPNGEIYLDNAGINYTLSTPTAFTSDYAYSLSGDLDGDGDLDIFNANSYNGTNWNTLPLKFFRNNSSGTFTTTTTALVLPVLWTTDLSDYDSDGDLDHIYLNPATGEIKVLLNGNTVVALSPKVFLQGPYNTSNSKMNDQLRASGLIPLSEPFTALGMALQQGAGSSVTDSATVFSDQGDNSIVDWMLVELRDEVDSAVLYSQPFLLQRDGDIVGLNGVSSAIFNGVSSGNYFVAVRHRNHLGVMTHAPVGLSANAATIDFTLSSTQTYGSNARKILNNGKMALWAGDANGNNNIKYNGSSNDRNTILGLVGLMAPNNNVAAYSSADCNLDGLVKYNGSNNDRNVVLANVGLTTPNLILIEQLPP